MRKEGEESKLKNRRERVLTGKEKDEREKRDDETGGMGT